MTVSPADDSAMTTDLLSAQQSQQSTATEMDAPEARLHSGGLSAEELTLFDRKGWIGGYPLLSPRGADELFRAGRRAARQFLRKELHRNAADEAAFERRPWYKSMHAYLPTFGRLASHPAIVTRVASILGPDIIAWGMTTSTLRPGQRHRWHVDIEHRRWPGVSVFIGLRNIARGSSLKVISGSHRVDCPPGAGGRLSDAEALSACRKVESNSELVTAEIGEGEFFIFHGRLWHGSHNRTWRVRTALIAQYAR